MTDQQRHESPEIGAMIGRMLNALIRRAADGDTEALEALAEIEYLAPAAMSAGLAVAHWPRVRNGQSVGVGYSYAELAAPLGVSRSAIAQRIARVDVTHTGGSECMHPLCVGVKRCRAPKILPSETRRPLTPNERAAGWVPAPDSLTWTTDDGRDLPA